MSVTTEVFLVAPHASTDPALVNALRAAGWSVSVVTPAALVERARAATMDVRRVVLAPPTPDLLTTLQELRAATRPHSPVLLAVVDGDSPTTELAAPFDDAVRAPVHATEVVARIRHHLAVREALEEEARRAHDAEVTLELTQALASALDFREILYTVVRRIAEHVRVDRVSIVLAPESADSTVGYVVAASDDAHLANLQIDLSKYPEILETLRTREPLTITDASTHPLLDGVRCEGAALGPTSMTLFPIVWEDEAVGVLFLRTDASRGGLSPRETRLCRLVANATAVALRNARAVQSLRDQTQQVAFARFEAERRLRSLRRYADLFAASADGIAVIDPDGRLLFANPCSYRLLGYAEGTLRGVKVRTLLHPDEQDAGRALWERIRSGECPHDVDVRLVRSDGAVRIVSASFSRLGGDDGSVLVSFRDVTDHRRTEAELRKTTRFLESLIEASVDGIVASDMTGQVILFNAGAERIYGYRADEVVGKLHVRELYPGDGAREVMRMLRSPQYGGVGRLEAIRFAVKDRHGQAIPVSLSAAIIHDQGKPVATFGIFTDLRERLRVEERLAAAQQRLALTERQAVLAELAGATAHELNQPLTSVMAYAELLRRQLPEGSATRRAVEAIASEAGRMAEIVRKIGKITRYETKSYVGTQRILDLERASTDASAEPQTASDAPPEPGAGP
ncbi:MAG: PAS domain S-box protein [Myxococcota bacterium]|nr:PAS domain S-box protein [Myxococcota bacterium]MDW8363773.1 PAS domain S-box protein [Myxococcales bacterium]